MVKGEHNVDFEEWQKKVESLRDRARGMVMPSHVPDPTEFQQLLSAVTEGLAEAVSLQAEIRAEGDRRSRFLERQRKAAVLAVDMPPSAQAQRSAAAVVFVECFGLNSASPCKLGPKKKVSPLERKARGTFVDLLFSKYATGDETAEAVAARYHVESSLADDEAAVRNMAQDVSDVRSQLDALQKSLDGTRFLISLEAKLAT